MAYVLRVAITTLLLIGGNYLVEGTDVTLNSWSCNHNLNIYATDFKINCASGSSGGCTMGDGVSYEGKLVYSGVVSKYAYLNLSIKKFGVGTKFYYKGEKVNLCSRVTSNDGGCYADGLYNFYSSTSLPSLGDKDWLLTGSNFNVQLDIYKDEDMSNLIGTCRANVDAEVTKGASKFMNPPSATRTAAIFAGVIGAFALLTTCMCLWMDQQEKKQLQAAEGQKEQHEFNMLDDPSIGKTNTDGEGVV
uniref:Uncharacterized protein n=2 Tax=Ditylum brightwellii TaxID=49249 RepID=A0A6U3NJ88_9STRA|mmetsp:Transcript_21552/g.28367  ORF Transcript_21552/g.28367 Transcript_21552/m.28367 type:complete len:247 (-) Transcript_21552:151-891(-)